MASKMRNPAIAMEIIADIVEGKCGAKDKAKPYVIATLDGTILFVREEEIIW